MRLDKRIERQRRLVETLERRLAFERLVLARLEARDEGADRRRSEPKTQAQSQSQPQRSPMASIADVYRAARLRAAR